MSRTITEHGDFQREPRALTGVQSPSTSAVVTPGGDTSPTAADTTSLLAVRALDVELTTPKGGLWAVRDVSFDLARGASLGIVGESGCGKSTLARAIMHLLPSDASLGASSRIEFNGVDTRALIDQGPSSYRGTQIGLVFQDPATSLNPVRTIGKHLTDPMRFHLGLSRAEATERAAALLDEVGINNPRIRLKQYPHELSGGMRQRVMIAIALSCQPKLLIADEPTTAVDVTVERQIVELLSRIQAERDMGIIFISHNLRLIEDFADDVAVMYVGRIVEHGPTAAMFESPSHPYTAALLAATPGAEGRSSKRLVPVTGRPPDLMLSERGCSFAPRCTRTVEQCRVERPALTALDGRPQSVACLSPVPVRAPGDSGAATVGATSPDEDELTDEVASAAAVAEQSGSPLLVVDNVFVEYQTPRGVLQAVAGVSFSVNEGETLSIVGETGCGKSSVGRSILHLPAPTAGAITFDEVRLTDLDAETLRSTRRRLQMVFQDPIAALNPRKSVRDLVGEGLTIWKSTTKMTKHDVTQRVDELLEAVALDPAVYGDRRAFQLSGGQCQRVAIARSLALDPRVIICDEPVSALDVSVQAQILNLLQDLKERFALSLVFISHDLGVVRHVSDRVVVMYLGRICEVAPTETLFDSPLHPYTQLLLASVPGQGRSGSVRDAAIELPSPLNPPSGCRFRTLCPRADQRCADEVPELREFTLGSLVACHHPGNGAWHRGSTDGPNGAEAVGVTLRARGEVEP